MTKAELIEAMKDFPDDMEVLASSGKHFDIYEIVSAFDDGGVILLRIE